MPELPDVEVFSNYIKSTALHDTIDTAEFLDAGRLVDGTPATLKRRLAGATLEQTRRHGKHLGVQLDNGKWLMLHFGMTGELDYAKDDDDDLPPHTRVVLHFNNGYRLAYMNQRKLGRIRISGDFDEFINGEGLGPDALEIDRDTFTKLLSSGRGTLKTRLMNQYLIAGLGNVYTDELFFQARIHPGTRVNDVEQKQAAELWRVMRRMLRSAIDHHARPEEFPNSWLTRHRDEQQCPRCGGELKKAKIGGRSSQFCPKCQSPP